MEKETEVQHVAEIETPKNKWLYTTDNFGKLEPDMVFETKTYKRSIQETEIVSLHKITSKPTKRLKKKK
jgi:hypothetical protein